MVTAGISTTGGARATGVVEGGPRVEDGEGGEVSEDVEGVQAGACAGHAYLGGPAGAGAGGDDDAALRHAAGDSERVHL